MNNTPRREDRLIADTFHDDWNDGPAAAFARAAAAKARRRRTRRRIGAGAAGAIAVALLIGLGVSEPPAARSSAAPLAQTQPRGYEVISDAELLTALRDRSVVMVRQPGGTREFVLGGQ